MRKFLLFLSVMIAFTAIAVIPTPTLDPNQTYSTSIVYKDVYSGDEITGKLSESLITTYYDNILSVHIANESTSEYMSGSVYAKSLNGGEERSFGFVVYPGACSLCGKFYCDKPDGVIEEIPKPTYFWDAEIMVRYQMTFMPTTVYWVYRFRGV